LLIVEAEELVPVSGLHYIAPDPEYTKAADIYPFALIPYEIVVGQPVFLPAMGPDDVRRKLAAGERRRIPESVPRFVRNLIRFG
jgi:hypothetical protein